MAVSEVRQPGWRDELRGSRFPFDDLASLAGNSGEFIPPEIFADAILHPIGADDIVHLSRVEIVSNEATLTIGTGAQPSLAQATFDMLSPPEQLAFSDQYGRPAGVLAIDTQAIGFFQAWDQGVHSFTPEQTRFAAACCVPLPEPGVRGVVLDDGSMLTGEIWLVGDEGIVLTPATEELVTAGGGTETVRTIRVDVVGDPLFRRRLCSPVFQTPRFLRSVTFRQGCQEFTCRPDRSGVIRLMVGSRYGPGTVLRVSSQDETLRFEAVGDLMRPE